MEKSSSLNGVDYLDKLRESNEPEGLEESSTRPQARSRRRASRSPQPLEAPERGAREH